MTLTASHTHLLHKAIRDSSSKLILSFSHKDPLGCASLYEDMAMLNCINKPLYVGKSDIQLFWQSLIAEKWGEVELLDLMFDFISTDSVSSTTHWKIGPYIQLILKDRWSFTDDYKVSIFEQSISTRLIPASIQEY